MQDTARSHGDPRSLGDSPRVGVWLVGARGSVATTAVVGAAAIAAGLASATGCVTESPDFTAAADSSPPSPTSSSAATTSSTCR